MNQTNYNQDLQKLPMVKKKQGSVQKDKAKIMALHGHQVNRHASQGAMPAEYPNLPVERMLAAHPLPGKNRNRFLDYASGVTPSSTTFFDTKTHDLKMPHLDSKHTTID